MKIDITCTECEKDKSEFDGGILTVESAQDKDLVYIFCSLKCRNTFFDKKAGYDLSQGPFTVWKKK